jgi:ABC-2 type transport system permease protein
MDRIRTIIDKEWAEVFKNRLVLFTVTLLPLLFTAMPLIMLSTIKGSTTNSVGSGLSSDCGSLSSTDCIQIIMSNEFLLLFMILPVMIPITIAAYSIVGEKATRSLEPLLATPITTVELMAGKTLAAVLPGIVATWGCFLIFILLLPITGISTAVRAYLTSGIWLLAIIIIGPLMAVLAANFAVIVSSRVNDPRVAEQFSAVLLVPLLIVLFLQIAGVIVLNVQSMIFGILGFIALDCLVIYLGSKLFQRENILTRWR